MTFDPLVIDDLGAKLYSTLPPIISELIANGYDACAKKVWIELIGTGDEKSIKIKDNGFGMNFEEIERKYLKIGRKKRKSEIDNGKKCDRPPMGKKGLGKLAFFGIAERAVIETIQDRKKVTFEMDWQAIQKVPEEESYNPVFKEEDTDEKNGTTVILTKMYKKTNFDIDALKKSISNYFIFDDDFKVLIKEDSDEEFLEIDNELRYQVKDKKQEFFWEFPEEVTKMELLEEFPFAKDIRGKIITFDKPVPSRLRGVTLFSRKKLVNLPEFFPVQGSSHFYQYLTGWLEIDFIDNFEPDVIATNRSSLNWNDLKLKDLELFLEKIVKIIHEDWRKLWSEKTTKEISEKFSINAENWKESNESNPTLKKNIAKFTKILGDTEKIERDELIKVSEIVYDLAPEHAEFVLWRNLNNKIKGNNIIKERFFQKRYLEATREAVQIYNEAVQQISGRTEDGCPLMEICYGKEETKLIWITNKSNDNEKNIDDGQKLLSQGLIKGFKNPAVSHTSITKGMEMKDFSDRNCLDILNTISYLFDRLESRTKVLS